MLSPFMRALHPSLILSLALTMGLSACGRDSDPAGNRMDQTQLSTEIAETPGNQVTAIDPGANESVAADRADTVPVTFQGRWTGAKDNCTDAGAELELQITPKELIFHESVGTITRITRQEGGKVAIDAAFTGEGQSWTRRLEVRASADGQTLTIANDGQAVVRKRCDTPA
ncbi:hypothetical protein [Sphingobium aromaticiconvertens]|uniref:hypothetical protein n=1 Tax=Sphingobium aromaticiconvertens TaxID=365341 RepID=UPI003018DEE5